MGPTAGMALINQPMALGGAGAAGTGAADTDPQQQQVGYILWGTHAATGGTGTI